jgi:uncharacterized protein (DUF1501 family)
MSNNLSLSQLAPSQNNKTITINDANGELDASLTEVLTTAIDNTNAATISLANFQRHQVFVFVDAGTPPDATVMITVPAIKRGMFIIDNQLSTHTVEVEITGQTPSPPSTVSGAIKLVFADGASVRGM